jgi:RNA polymerase sigma-70 factor (ECF subfamily)
MPDWQNSDKRLADGHHQDQELILVAKKGDADAFGRLYERHAPAVFRFIYAHLNSRHDAEDLTNELFLRVWRVLPDYNDQGVPFKAYLFRIARNMVIDQYRKKNPEIISDEDIEEQNFRDERPEPEEYFEMHLERQEVREYLQQLREEYRTVLVLRFLGDLSPNETAEVMGKSAGAIRVIQHRALIALRKLLAPRGQR